MTMTKKPDNVVISPLSSKYPTNVGAPAFTIPDVITKGKERGINASHQLEAKFEQLKEEYFKLVSLSEDTAIMYSARCSFIPVVGRVYHLYNSDKGPFISLIGPDEWNKEHIGSYKLTSEQTWERVID